MSYQLADWRRMASAAPSAEAAIASLTDATSEWWPFVAVAVSPTRWTRDQLRSAIAFHMEEHFSPTFWPVALHILLPPYPTEATCWLNLLSLAHARAAAFDRSAASRRYFARSVALLVAAALRDKEVVALEALNVMGGLGDGGMVFSSVVEREALTAGAEDGLSRLEDSALAAQMRDRATATIGASVVYPFSAADAESLQAQGRSIWAEAIAALGPELRSRLSHAEMQIRTWAESQVGGDAVLGALAARLSRRALGAHPLGAIQHLVDFIAALLGGEMRAQPVSLATGSLEIVFRLEADPQERPRLVDVAERIGNILSRNCDEKLPTELSDLLQSLKRAHLSLEVELRAPDGTARETRFDHAETKAILAIARGRRRLEVRSLDVPQADSLDRVFRVAEVLAEDRELNSVTLDEVSERQVAYYRQAARILGLLDAAGCVTVAGQLIASLRDRRERVRRAAFLFEVSKVGCSWLNWAGVPSVAEVSPETAEAFLRERSELSGDTVGRRATTLATWVGEFKKAMSRNSE